MVVVIQYHVYFLKHWNIWRLRYRKQSVFQLFCKAVICGRLLLQISENKVLWETFGFKRDDISGKFWILYKDLGMTNWCWGIINWKSSGHIPWLVRGYPPCPPIWPKFFVLARNVKKKKERKKIIRNYEGINAVHQYQWWQLLLIWGPCEIKIYISLKHILVEPSFFKFKLQMLKCVAMAAWCMGVKQVMNMLMWWLLRCYNSGCDYSCGGSSWLLTRDTAWRTTTANWPKFWTRITWLHTDYYLLVPHCRTSSLSSGHFWISCYHQSSSQSVPLSSGSMLPLLQQERR